MKKFLSVFLAASMIVCVSVPALANEPTISTDSALEINYNEIDASKPYEISREFVNSEGEEVTVGLIFTPSVNNGARGSSTDQASVGTWKSYYDGVTVNLSYEFDMNKSGTHWNVSNMRHFNASSAIARISDKEYQIDRATSTARYPAELYASCMLEILDTGIVGPIATTNPWLKTTVSDAGVVTTSWGG